MKKIIILLLVIGVLYYLFSDGSGGSSNIKIMGYKGNVTNIENGNTLVLNSGLKVQLLGVKQNHEHAELWIKNNLIGKTVQLVSDSKNEQTFNKIGATVKAYVIIERNGKKVCANRLIIEDNRDCATLAFVNDSTTMIPQKKSPTTINDKALYMKQRTMLVETSNSIGTAFFINKNGVALTNNHVLDGSKPACVYLYAQDAEDSKIYSSRRRNIRNILWTNKALDITVFSVELEQNEEAAYFNLISQHEPVGNNCHILGNPQGFMASYASGQISAYRDDAQVKGRKLIQYNMSTNGGNSGGPVMNDKGEIIAVHAMGIKSAQGLNFGIDILQVKEILDSPGINVNYGGK